MRFIKWPVVAGVLALALIIHVILLARGRVVIESQLSDERGPRVQIRELQFDNFSFEGILGKGEKLYRMEYYRRDGEPLVACVSLMDESNFPGEFQIEWVGFRKGIVRENGVIRYTLEKEVWRAGR